MPANVKGILPAQLLHSVQVDRHGLISATVKRYRLLSESGFLEALRDAPAIGLPLVGVQYAIQNGRAEIDYAYEGIDPSLADPSELTTYELDTSMSEDSIKTHPSFAKLKKIYGWDDEKEQFPEFLPDSAGADNALQASGTSTQQKSDLAGADSYLSVGAIYRITYAARSMPAGLLRGIGTIVTPPGIGRFSIDAGQRNWLKLAPKVRLRGNCLEITEEYMLSGPRGWNTDVYDAGQLGGSGGDAPGSGLHGASGL
jgi:hypothetical protein